MTGEELTNGVKHAPEPKILIIGCNGRMGKMLLERGKSKGLLISGIDRPFTDAKLAESCHNIDLAMLCIPAKNLDEFTARLANFLPANAILADITSVKEAPMRIMEKNWQGPVVGSHPLFGPNISEEEDLPVALAQGKNATASHVRMVEGMFAKLGFRTFMTDAKTHDKAMAKIQNMNFITNLAYFSLLAEETDLLPFITPSFERRKKAAEKMLTEDAEMFAGLFETNYHSHETVRQFRKMLNVAASGDIDLLLRRAQWWWQDKQNIAKSQDQTHFSKANN